MYRLIQEDYIDDPWKVLVCCILLNRTTGTAVREILPRLFAAWPTPESMANADDLELYNLISGLGLGDKRRWYLKEMSRRYSAAMSETGGDLARLHVQNLPGCGKYAKDCWLLLVMKRVPLLPVTDKELRKYMAREKML